jgi:hypothetical protein
MEAVNMAKGRTPVSTLTTNSGSPVEDNQNSITAGSRGPALLQDSFDEPPWSIASVLTIGIATMLSLVLLQLITAGP